MPDCSGGRRVDTDILQRPNKLDSLFLEGYRFGKVSKVSQLIDMQKVEGPFF